MAYFLQQGLEASPNSLANWEPDIQIHEPMEEFEFLIQIATKAWEVNTTCEAQEAPESYKTPEPPPTRLFKQHQFLDRGCSGWRSCLPTPKM